MGDECINLSNKPARIPSLKSLKLASDESGEKTTEYDVPCPHCGGKLVNIAITRPTGKTYQEPMIGAARGFPQTKTKMEYRTTHTGVHCSKCKTMFAGLPLEEGDLG